MSSGRTVQGGERDFGAFLLNCVLVVGFLVAAALIAVYLVPPEHLTIPQREVSIRVARAEDFPVGSSRMETWGDEAILVVRRTETEYAALQGVGSVDGCLLEWDAEALRVFSPCRHQLYNLRGHAVEGLTTDPLQLYAVFVRDGVVYVTRD